MNIEKKQAYYRVLVDDFLIVDIIKIIIEGEISPKRYRYKAIEHTINSEYELSESEEERLKKKYGFNNWFFDDRENRDDNRIVSGVATFEKGDLVEEITDKYILQKVNEKKEQLEKNSENFLKCPITGGRLVNLGSDRNVIDGPCCWIVEGYEDVRYETSPWVRGNIFFGSDSCYKWYADKKEWKEQISICDGNKFVDKPKTAKQEENIQKIISEYEEKNKKELVDYVGGDNMSLMIECKPE